MLVIPIEQKLDSSNPPVATLLLIVLCMFVFFGYQQSNDPLILQSALDYYEKSNLLAEEEVAYTEYMLLKNPDRFDVFETLDPAIQRLWIVQDVEFTHFLNTDYFLHNVTSLAWMDARAELDRITENFSFLKHGFIPANFSIFDLITSMFLHGDTGHLIGNMIFLFIYGFSLEIALGRRWFLGIYMLSGIAGSALTWITSMDSVIPTVGASGAIFGLLGMYLGLYGLKKIKFFFTAGFFAHHFKAPALILLPYWALIELYDQFAGQDFIAHYAHLGGLIAGAALVYFGKERLIKINRDYVEKVDNDAPFRHKYELFLRQLEQLNIPQAKNLLNELLELREDDLRLLKHQFDLLKLNPSDPDFEKIAKQLFSQASIRNAEVPVITRIANEYGQLSELKEAFDIPTRINLFNLYLRAEQSQEAEEQLGMLRECPEAQNKLPGLMLHLANHLSARNQGALAMRYKEEILNSFPESDAAEEIKAITTAMNASS